ncbi:MULTISPECIES: branched-chain amino acid ABC transporter permease [Craterilacuibacter]|uniref:Branched-chain amino acid ABC transporter permease n=1 Tax=Craterilacuibacter sinensis TaxID=2686017 RepID=A0A845BSM2_9NEIS|nr:branched-chain amino acid ABC transporter permease [Craterilacuibacter sinensis]MCL6263095.1 branched-chain amino acid ABC transporter permease [Craterilacuibacter sp. RT1T]MCP9758396.1 branched-chain amino acid ABC transporter permease [Aquitalea sp. S1-19]MXR37186.1 branched-chain amino acid ABC transporter permease [Craterilacuibacter sinensis]RQW28913.1 branched-chain amino acid ABC transporter permease [Rhodobacteraceae bacterium CH30]
MDIFLQQILNGLVLGSIYALIALGYTMVYGIMGLINFAHGEVVMVGGMVTVTVVSALLGMGINLPALALILIGVMVAIPACMLLGFTIERVAYRPLRNAPRLAPLITAIGVSIVLQQLAILVWGRNYIPFPPILDHDVVEIFGASITKLQVSIVVLCFVIMTALLVVVEKTKLGRAMRATSQNPAVAGLMGVNVNTIISTTFVIGSALGAIAGLMVATNYEQVHYYMGFMIGLKAFTAAVLGGIGNLGGAVAGGILLGIIESLGAGYIGDLTGGFLGSHYQDIFAFMVLIAVLIFRPSGLMGEKMADRA